jgi:hypothetical protein
MEAERLSFEASANFCQTTRRRIAEDSPLQEESRYKVSENMVLQFEINFYRMGKHI